MRSIPTVSGPQALENAPYTWRTQDPDLLREAELFTYAAQKGVKKIALLTQNDDTGKGYAARLPDLAKKNGMDLVGSEFWRADGTAGGPLGDPYLSRNGPRISVASGGAISIVASRPAMLSIGGSAVEGERRFSPAELDEGIILGLQGRVLLLVHRTGPARAAAAHGLILGQSDAIARVRDEIARAGPLEAWVKRDR